MSEPSRRWYRVAAPQAAEGFTRAESPLDAMDRLGWVILEVRESTPEEVEAWLLREATNA